VGGRRHGKTMKITRKEIKDTIESVDLWHIIAHKGIYVPSEDSYPSRRRIVSDGMNNVYFVIIRPDDCDSPDKFEPLLEHMWRKRKFVKVNETINVEFS